MTNHENWMAHAKLMRDLMDTASSALGRDDNLTAAMYLRSAARVIDMMRQINSADMVEPFATAVISDE